MGTQRSANKMVASRKGPPVLKGTVRCSFVRERSARPEVAPPLPGLHLGTSSIYVWKWYSICNSPIAHGINESGDVIQRMRVNTRLHRFLVELGSTDPVLWTNTLFS